MIKAFSILLAALFLGVAPISASANLLGVTFDNQLISIDTTTGAGSLIGNLDSEMSAFGLADYNGSVYTFDQRADLIRQIDISSGDTLNSFDIGIGDIVGEGSLTFANNGTGYLTTSSDTSGKLYSFDIVTGKSELISDVLGSFDGMDFNNTGMLYGKRQYTGEIYIIDPATGATTFQFNTTDDDSLSGLTFDENGVLYYEKNGNLFANNANLGSIGFSDRVSGLTAVTTSVPEPSAVLLLGIGLASIFGLRRRIK